MTAVGFVTSCHYLINVGKLVDQHVEEARLADAPVALNSLRQRRVASLDEGV